MIEPTTPDTGLHGSPTHGSAGRVGRHVRTWGSLVVWLASMVVVSEVRAAEPEPTDPREPQHPRVVWQTDPQTSATVVWHTRGAGHSHSVRFGRVPSEEPYGPELTQTARAQSHAEFEGRAHFHYAHLQGLSPDTTYGFVARTDDRQSRRWTFRTAPEDSDAFSLLYGGDSRSDPQMRRRVNRLIRRIAKRRDDVVGFVHGGDYTNLGMNWNGWQQWLDDHTETYIDSRQLPMIPARGNHEYSRANLRGELDNYNGVFGLPGGPDNDYWATEFGHQLTLITLDSTASLGGRQRDWLESTLQTADRSTRWIVANYHHPAYPAVKSPSGTRVHWTPLFEKYDLDLACESDGHVLKRTVPIRDGRRASRSEGIVYVGEGGLGVPQRDPDRSRWYLQSPGIARSVHHVQLLTFRRDELIYRAYGLDGELLDRWRQEPHRQFGSTPVVLVDARWRSPGEIQLELSRPVDGRTRRRLRARLVGTPISVAPQPAADTAPEEASTTLSVNFGLEVVGGMIQLHGPGVQTNAAVPVTIDPDDPSWWWHLGL